MEEGDSSDGDEAEYHVLGRGIFEDSAQIFLREVVGGGSGRLQVGEDACQVEHVSLRFCGVWLVCFGD